MSTHNFQSVALADVAEFAPTNVDWFWDGYLAPGNITLFTSLWKSGKTTLLAGLLQALERGELFLGRATRPAQALVVSEESMALWAERTQVMPIGPHAHLLSRPFLGRPDHADWQALLDNAAQRHRDGHLDLLVIDTMTSFLPGAWESHPIHLMEALEPMQRLAADGIAVLLLHHPRKKASEPGHSARGTGALLGFVDIALELTRFGRLRSDDRRRQLVALSRRPATPDRLVYEWDPATGRFTVHGDPGKVQFERNWATLLDILTKRKVAATHHELLQDWPNDQPRPAASVLYEWLNRAFEEKRLRRQGQGTRTNPWRYRLENKDDYYYDQGMLPPL